MDWILSTKLFCDSLDMDQSFIYNNNNLFSKNNFTKNYFKSPARKYKKLQLLPKNNWKTTEKSFN